MYTKISVLVPTRKRVPRLVTLMQSYDRTSDGATSELVYRCDEDDAETRWLLADKLTVVGPRLNGYRSVGTFFNEMLRLASGDVLMLGNDDMVFRTEGWAAMLLAEANKYPDGMFNLGVSTFNETHFPFSCVSRIAVERLGFLWDPRLAWGDVFLRDVFGAFGRCVMVPQVVIDHDWAGHAPDAVFNEGKQHELHGDAGYWDRVHAPAVNEAVMRLRGVA